MSPFDDESAALSVLVAWAGGGLFWEDEADNDGGGDEEDEDDEDDDSGFLSMTIDELVVVVVAGTVVVVVVVVSSFSGDDDSSPSGFEGDGDGDEDEDDSVAPDSTSIGTISVSDVIRSYLMTNFVNRLHKLVSRYTWNTLRLITKEARQEIYIYIERSVDQD